MRIKGFFLCLCLSFSVHAQQTSPYPSEITMSLKLSGTNRSELIKVIEHFKKSTDKLKLQAAYFLIKNMHIHQSRSYRWIDKNGRTIPFDELTFRNYPSAIQAFNQLKNKNLGVKSETVILKDLTHIGSDLLINNIELAFQSWRNSVARNIPFKDFCEYILPYRVANEPLQNWREQYYRKFKWAGDLSNKSGIPVTLESIALDSRSWFKNTWNMSVRFDPLPRLGASQLLFRKEGRCEDVADLEVFTLRSQGIPASLDIIPYWATSSDGHYLNAVFDKNMKPIIFDATRTPPINNKISREPSKVLRITYSKQPSALASFYPREKIPDNILRSTNYIDVTAQYWETTSVTTNLNKDPKEKIAYINVFNKMNWKPTWWAKISNSKATFTAMSKGCVYLPSVFSNGSFVSSGPPVAVGYNNTLVLKPDKSKLRNILLNEEANRLIYQPNKKYRLYYWDDKWVLVGLRISSSTKSLLFSNAPNNALFILVPEYSKGKERPFIVTNKGQRVWF